MYIYIDNIIFYIFVNGFYGNSMQFIGKNVFNLEENVEFLL